MFIDMKDAGLDPVRAGRKFGKVSLTIDAFGEPLRKALSSSSDTLMAGGRVRHRSTGQNGRVTFLGKGVGQSIACEWDDGSMGLYDVGELVPEL